MKGTAAASASRLRLSRNPFYNRAMSQVDDVGFDREPPGSPGCVISYWDRDELVVQMRIHFAKLAHSCDGKSSEKLRGI
jgi:hypothetical protein